MKRIPDQKPGRQEIPDTREAMPLAEAMRDISDQILPELRPVAEALAGEDRTAAESAWETLLAEILDES